MSITITFKPIKGEPFKVEIEESAKVADLKKKIAEMKPDSPAQAQKLIFTGRILQDETTISEIGIKPDSFIVIMVSAVQPKAPPPAPAPAASVPTPAAADTPASAMDTAPSTAPPAPGPLPAALTDLKSNPKWPELARVVASDPGQLNRMLPALARWPDVRTAIMQNLEGFLIMCRQEAGVHDTTPMPRLAVAGQGGAGGPGGPQAAALMQALRQNPEMMQRMLQELPAEMRQMAESNPEAFAAMIAQSAAGGGPGGGMGGMGGGGGMPAPAEIPAEISEADNASIEGLMAMGFEKAVATQAYFACDKNAELAANFLFDGGGDDPMGGGP